MVVSADNQVIPQGELHCIWMDAALVGYKLCDREYQCEGCPFDALIRPKPLHQIFSPSDRAADLTVQYKAEGDRRVPVDLIENILERLSGSLDRRKFSDDRLYHLNHTWIFNDRIESIAIGIDHFAAYLLKPVVGVVLPQPPVHVEQNTPCAWIVMHEGTIAIRSPLSGTVVRVNRQLRDHPALINTDPYHEGWILRIAPRDFAKSLDHLHSSVSIGEHFSTDLEKLQGIVRQHLNQYFDTVGATLPDGGFRLADLQEILGSQKYFHIISTIIPGKH